MSRDEDIYDEIANNLYTLVEKFAESDALEQMGLSAPRQPSDYSAKKPLYAVKKSEKLQQVYAGYARQIGSTTGGIEGFRQYLEIKFDSTLVDKNNDLGVTAYNEKLNSIVETIERYMKNINSERTL